MSIGIEVAIRCRTFAVSNPLGVRMVQHNEHSGEVQLLNSRYSRTRFPFSYAWWSAFGYQRYQVCVCCNL